MTGGKIQYDYQFMSADKVGRFGFKKIELSKLAKNLKAINKSLNQQKNEADLSFLKLPYDNKGLRQILRLNAITVNSYPLALIMLLKRRLLKKMSLFFLKSFLSTIFLLKTEEAGFLRRIS